MATPEIAPPAAAGWYGSAFGLSVTADQPVPGIPARNGAPGGRPVAWRRLEPAAVALAPEPVETLVDLRHPSGEEFMTIVRDAAGSYRIASPGLGVHSVAADGSWIESRVPRVAPQLWQRPFFAQVLPLAAALRGFEVFHASAVELDGRTVALTGASGVGKSSLVLSLVLLGARFVTDDVLAVEPGRLGAVLAHPGVGVAHLEPSELALIDPRLRSRLGPLPHGADGKLVVSLAPAHEPRPLDTLVFLVRDRSAGSLSLRRDPLGQVRTLLGSTFLRYLRSATRLAGHLDACSRVVASTRTYELRIPPSASARETAEFLTEPLAADPRWSPRS